MNNTGTKYSVLIVDDLDSNLDIMMEILGEDYDISVAMTGQEALDLTAQFQYELILLDVMLPDMNGFDICRTLKKNMKTESIPVIFVTAHSGDREERMGFDAGAEDFIKRPLSAHSLKTRIDNIMELKFVKDQLLRKNKRIEEDFQKLQKLEELRDDLVHMVIHDMRSPLMGIMLNLGMIAQDKDQLSEENYESLVHSIKAVEKINFMAEEMVLLSKMEQEQFQLCFGWDLLKKLIENSILQLGALVKTHKIQLTGFNDTQEVYCDSGHLERVFQNILSNAIKFSPQDSLIQIQCLQKEEGFEIIFSDEGCGIQKEYQERLFDKYFHVEKYKSENRKSIGLGLAYCKMTIEKHDGKIWYVGNPEKGTSFHITLPIQQKIQ